MAEEKKQKFELRRIYVKDISFESPMVPGIFTTETPHPAVNVQLNVRHQALDNDLYECVITVTVSGKLGEKDAFLAEIQQAGLFEISGIDDGQALTVALEVACPNILYPFARETVNDIAGKGGFPQLLLSPVQFETLFRQKMQRQAGDRESGASDGDAAAAAENDTRSD